MYMDHLFLYLGKKRYKSFERESTLQHAKYVNGTKLSVTDVNSLVKEQQSLNPRTVKRTTMFVMRVLIMTFDLITLVGTTKRILFKDVHFYEPISYTSEIYNICVQWFTEKTFQRSLGYGQEWYPFVVSFVTFSRVCVCSLSMTPFPS